MRKKDRPSGKERLFSREGLLPHWAEFNLASSQVVVDLNKVAPVALKAIGVSALDTYTLSIISPNISTYIRRILNNNTSINFSYEGNIPVSNRFIRLADEWMLYEKPIIEALEEFNIWPTC